jgi:hypothetical protein
MNSKPKKSAALIALPDSTELKEFRKTNEAIGLRVSEGRLSLLSRKLFNVMMYHAQQQREPGGNAPLTTEAAKKYFWIPLAEVARDAAYHSNDTEKLKVHLEELQNIRVHMEDGIQWTSQRLVSAVTLVNPAGLKKRGGQLWFGFAFPPEVAALVTSPGSSYTKLAIYYQTMLRSGTSLALYEICRRFLTNPSRVTYRQDWEWWYGALSGNPVADTMPQYKYFKRDVIKPAIAEINMTTDIDIELIEHTEGRRIIALQFKVQATPQASLAFPVPPVIDSARLARIMKLGVGQADAENYLLNTEEATLEATLNLVEKRVGSSAKTKIDSPAAYFRQALKNGYALGEHAAVESPAKIDKPVDPALETPDQLRERYLTARAKEAYALFMELEDDQQQHWQLDFKAQRKASRAHTTSNMSSALYRNEFSYWFAQQQWKEPSADDIIRFAIAYPKAASGSENVLS